MTRIELIYNHPKYRDKYIRLVEAEKTREFCNHTMTHFLDVARIMYIKVLEDDLTIIDTRGRECKEILYAMALMHDIGRIDQIDGGISHDLASADFCREILPECGFDNAEIACIAEAISQHRNRGREENRTKENGTKEKGTEENLLGELLFWADKKSRDCYNCKMIKECNWSDEQKNKKIDY